MQDGDDLGIGLDSDLTNHSSEETDLTDTFWMLFPVVVFFGLLVALFVVF